MIWGIAATVFGGAHFDRLTADRGGRDAGRTGGQWKRHMPHQGRHHALAIPEDVNRAWRRYLHPEYAETEDYREVTSHYGRHHFSSYWRLKDRASREQVSPCAETCSAGMTKPTEAKSR